MTLNDIFANINTKYNEIEDFMTPYLKGMGKINFFDKHRKNDYFVRSMDNLTNLLLLFKLFIIDTNKKIANKSPSTFAYLIWSLLDIAARINREVLTIKECCVNLNEELLNTTLYNTNIEFDVISHEDLELLDSIKNKTTKRSIDITSIVNRYMAQIKETFPATHKKSLAKNTTKKKADPPVYDVPASSGTTRPVKGRSNTVNYTFSTSGTAGVRNTDRKKQILN